MGWGDYDYRPYVSQKERQAKAAAHAKKLAKKSGEAATPVKPAGLKAARSFWGVAWCQHIEKFSDYRNRLPRGMTYLRNGSVFDLKIRRGEVRALVSGSDIYEITIKIQTLSKTRWSSLKSACSRSIGSLLDLLQGKFDEGVMRRLSHPQEGLFPGSREIQMDCSCPDSASLCKHLAAVMYGIGTRLDTAPELLFTLRDVDHLELVGQALESENLNQALAGATSAALENADLGEMFGIELTSEPTETPAPAAPAKRSRRKAPAAPEIASPPARTPAKATKPKAAPQRETAAAKLVAMARKVAASRKPDQKKLKSKGPAGKRAGKAAPGKAAKGQRGRTR